MKSLFVSKTFWANFLGAIVTPWMGYLSGQVPKEVAIATSVTGVVNLGLRLVTTQPVSVIGS